MFERARARPTAGADSFPDDALEFLGPLFGTAMRLTRNRSEAEDLVQDTYVKAIRFRSRFKPGSNLKAWLYTILHNTWRNRRRDAGRDPVDVDSDRLDVVSVTRAGRPETPESLLLRTTLTPELKAALDDMPEAFREAVWLRDVEELSYAEIATALAVPLGTVMSRLSRGRRWLYRRLMEHVDPLPAAETVAVSSSPGLSATRFANDRETKS
jgi:RNA polymerase sigma-70 factor (ECF subfamily)